MSRSCSICAREDVEEINRDLFAGVLTFKQIHQKYKASVGALHRHKEHTKTQLMQTQSIDVTDSSGIMARVLELEARADKLYKDSVKNKDRLNASRALKELREILQLCARLTGELNTQQQVIHQHLHVTPEWARLRAVMLQALQPYPEARAALVMALESAQALSDDYNGGEGDEDA